MHPTLNIRLGTRRSALAKWQAQWVADRLRRLGVQVEIVEIVTQGDQSSVPITSSDVQGVFTREIQRALLQGRIDLAVHSLKDLPTAPVEGLCLAAVPPRESPGDVLICREPGSLEALPEGAVVGSGSMRRRAQLLRARPGLVVKPIRGNVDTRLRKLDEGQCDAIVLAEAGLRRLELAQRITQRLPFSIMLPAPGQGALGLETRADDTAARQMVERLDDPATRQAVVAERVLTATLQAGCRAPLGALAVVEDGRLKLAARVLSSDGCECVEADAVAEMAAAEQLGRRVAAELLEKGAGRLIQMSRAQQEPAQ